MGSQSPPEAAKTSDAGMYDKIDTICHVGSFNLVDARLTLLGCGKTILSGSAVYHGLEHPHCNPSMTWHSCELRMVGTFLGMLSYLDEKGYP